MARPKAQMWKPGEVHDYLASAAMSGGAVVAVDGLCGILPADLADAKTDGAQTEGIVKVEKKTGAVAEGQMIYWDNDGDSVGGTAGTGAATTVPVEATGDVRMGPAVAAQASGDEYVYADLNRVDPVAAPIISTRLWFDPTRTDPYTADGTFEKPYKTLTAAFAAVAAADTTILMMPGPITEAAEVTWPLFSGCRLVGVMGSSSAHAFTGAAGEASVINVEPGAAASSTFEVYIENINIASLDGLIGLRISNAAATAKLNIYLRNFGTEEGGTSNSIETVHPVTTEAIRIYADFAGEEIEGKVYLDIGNNGDRFRAVGGNFAGGIESSADAIVAEISLKNCEVKHEGVAGGNAQQVLTAVACYTQSGATIAPYDATDAGGSHTDNIVAFD